MAIHFGLQRLKSEQVVSYTTEDGLESSEVRAVLEDEQKMLWIGTTTGVERRDPVTGRFTEIWRSKYPGKEGSVAFSRIGRV